MPSIVSPPPCLTLSTPLGLSLNCSTIYLQYLSLSPSSILLLISSGCGRCGVQSFSLTAASPAGCSHSAPNASLEYWIHPRTTSALPEQYSDTVLLPSYYCARGPGAPLGWMGFESVLLWVKEEIIGRGGLSIWSCLILSLASVKTFLSVL